MMFVGLLGCYGAIQESQCLLGTVSCEQMFNYFLLGIHSLVWQMLYSEKLISVQSKYIDTVSNQIKSNFIYTAPTCTTPFLVQDVQKLIAITAFHIAFLCFLTVFICSFSPVWSFCSPVRWLPACGDSWTERRWWLHTHTHTLTLILFIVY